MPRPLRDALPGIHHVVIGATGPSPYYIDDTDRIDWIRRLVKTLEHYGWTCIALCLMTTHVHLLLETHDQSLPIGMHSLNTGYGKAFNDRHERRGNLLRARYWSKRIKDNPQLLAAFRYAARNPLRAGLCLRPEDWFWSSFATSCGLAETFPFIDASHILSLLGAPPATAWQVLSALVRE